MGIMAYFCPILKPNYFLKGRGFFRMSRPLQAESIGLWQLTALVSGNMIGSGIFLLPSALAHYGSISLLAWVFTAVGALMLALVFANLATYWPLEGGVYAYCSEAFGEFSGFQVAYNYWVALWVGNAALVVALTGYLSFFWPALATNSALACSVNIIIIWLLTLLNSLSIRCASLFQSITTVLKLVPLVGITIFGLCIIKPTHFTAFNLLGKSAFEAFNGAATLTLWSFLGLESAAIPTHCIKNPEKNIARATLLGVSIAAVLYIASYVAIIGVIPLPELAQSRAPYADAAQMMLGSRAQSWVAGLAVISCLGALTGWILLQGQVPKAAALDRLFPALFLKGTKKGVPIAGLVISSVLITGLLLLQMNQSLVSQFNFIVLLATLATLLPYFFTAMAALMLRVKHPEKFLERRLRGPIVVTILAGLYAFLAIIGAGRDIVFCGCLLLLSSLPVYVYLQWQRTRFIPEVFETASKRVRCQGPEPLA